MANRLLWHKRWSSVNSSDFRAGEIRWFEGGKLSVSENCLDRHLKTKADKIAIIWESDDGKESRLITYGELHHDVCNNKHNAN